MNQTFSIDDYNDELQGENDEGLLLSDYDNNNNNNCNEEEASAAVAAATVALNSEINKSDIFEKYKLKDEMLLFDSNFDLSSSAHQQQNINTNNGSNNQIEKLNEPTDMSGNKLKQINESLADIFLDNESDDLLIDEMQNFIDSTLNNNNNSNNNSSINSAAIANEIMELDKKFDRDDNLIEVVVKQVRQDNELDEEVESILNNLVDDVCCSQQQQQQQSTIKEEEEEIEGMQIIVYFIFILPVVWLGIFFKA